MIVNFHCTIPGIEVTSMRAKTMKFIAQLGLDDAKFLGWEDFLKMAKCRKGDGLMMNFNCHPTLNII